MIKDEDQRIYISYCARELESQARDNGDKSITEFDLLRAFMLERIFNCNFIVIFKLQTQRSRASAPDVVFFFMDAPLIFSTASSASMVEISCLIGELEGLPAALHFSWNSWKLSFVSVGF